MSDADGDDTASWDPLLHTGDIDDPPVASEQAGSCLDVSACVGEGTSRRFVEGGVNLEVDEGVIPDAADEVSKESTASATECRVSNAKGDAGADAPSNLPAEQAVPPASVLPVSRLTCQLSQASFDNMSRSDDGGNGGFHETPCAHPTTLTLAAMSLHFKLISVSEFADSVFPNGRNILAGAADAAREGFRKFASNIRAENGNSSKKVGQIYDDQRMCEDRTQASHVFHPHLEALRFAAAYPHRWRLQVTQGMGSCWETCTKRCVRDM
jgi:hypothetical protein